MAGSSGLHPLVSAAHKPMLATRASDWNLNVLDTMVLLRGSQTGEVIRSHLRPRVRAPGPHAKTTVRAMARHTCTAAYCSCLLLPHQRTSAFSGRKSGAALEGPVRPASTRNQVQTRKSSYRRRLALRHGPVHKTMSPAGRGDRLCRSCLTELQKKLKFCVSIDRRSQVKCPFVCSRPSSLSSVLPCADGLGLLQLIGRRSDFWIKA